MVSEDTLFSVSIFDEIVFNFQFFFKTVLKWNKGDIYGKKETFYKIMYIQTNNCFLSILRLQMSVI